MEVVGGSATYSVRLATTRTPSGEDEAVVRPGKTVELHTGDVDWGETIDGRLEYSARDGSGDTFVDELEEYSFTRPTREDCEAVAAPTSPHPTTSAPDTSAPETSAPQTSGDTSAPSAPSTGTSSGPAGATGGAGSDGGADGAKPAPQEVVAGATVTLQAAGFLPGERVTIRFDGSDELLGTAVAAEDGTVEAEIRIPAGTAAGPVSVALVGDDSAVTAAVELRVAAAQAVVAEDNGQDGTGDVVPLTTAAAALVLTMGALVSVAGRHRSGNGWPRRA